MREIKKTNDQTHISVCYHRKEKCSYKVYGYCCTLPWEASIVTLRTFQFRWLKAKSKVFSVIIDNMTLMLLIDIHLYVTWIFPLLILYLFPTSVFLCRCRYLEYCFHLVVSWYYFVQQFVAFMIYFKSRVLFFYLFCSIWEILDFMSVREFKRVLS